MQRLLAWILHLAMMNILGEASKFQSVTSTQPATIGEKKPLNNRTSLWKEKLQPTSVEELAKGC